MDLRGRFGFAAGRQGRASRIVVAELGAPTVGLIVDGASGVLMVPAEAIEPPSALVTTADSAYLRGVAKPGERLVLLPDLARILSGRETDQLAAGTGPAPPRARTEIHRLLDAGASPSSVGGPGLSGPHRLAAPR